MAEVKFRPRQDFILVKPIERKQSEVLAVVSYEKYCRGEVVAVGPGKRDKKGHIKPLDAKPGDVIAFGDGGSMIDNCFPEYREDGALYRIIQEADIVGVLE